MNTNCIKDLMVAILQII